MASPTAQSVGRLQADWPACANDVPPPSGSLLDQMSLPRSGGQKCRRETSPRAPDTGARGTARSRSAAGSRSSSIAFVLGGAIGTNTLADEDTGNGESRGRRHGDPRRGLPGQGRRAGARPGPRRQAEPSTIPQFKAGVDDVVAQLEKTPSTSEDVQSPLADGQRGPDLRGRPLRAGHVQHPRRRRAATRSSTPRSPPPRRRRRRHPDLRIEQFGDASADKALGASLDDDFKRAEFLSPPDHAAHPDRRLRRARRRGRAAAAGDHGRDRHARPRRPDQPDRADGGVRELGDPADRPRGRRRLLDVLPAPQDGGARRGHDRPRPRSSSPPPRPARRCSSPASRC